ncbi:N-acetylglucosamine kinase [Devosia pacifica]|uniref:N-acetylglucosamine kinase n=1 Tax=Devosia pacifica TaxID=1335967 RepID=UPI0016776FF3|nr:BadF/BadG/BcrA/BcrD ATPase family protein [Devosia pacifica]
MSSLLVGLDVGGSKTQVQITDLDGVTLSEQTIPNTSWALRSDADRAQILRDVAVNAVSGEAGEVVALVAGVHGSDSVSQQEILTAPLAEAFARVRVVNDSSLLVPASGRRSGTGVTAGTGSSATATTGNGTEIMVGGWGWVLGDECGAVGLVRDAAREVLSAYDAAEDDGLVDALLDALDITHPHALSHRLATGEPREWSVHARVVFSACQAGSPRAARVIESHAEAMTQMVHQLERRGGDVAAVVCAGGVMSNHQQMFSAFADSMHRRFGDRSQVLLLDVPPVAGAVNLARQLAGLAPTTTIQGDVR